MALVLQSGIGFGSGNGKHNLGWYATVEALQEAHPEGKDGDYAVVGSTDTVWVWDSDSNTWVDTDTKGQVESVNNLTGVVVLAAEDVKAIPQLSSIPSATSENVNMIFQYKGTTTSSYTNGYFYKCVAENPLNNAQQVSTMPEASAAEVGNVYQYTGETDTSYTNGNYYTCTSDGFVGTSFGQPSVERFSWKSVLTDISLATPSDVLPSSEARAPAPIAEGTMYLYTGENITGYTQGNVYKCHRYTAAWGDEVYYSWQLVVVYDSSNSTYTWQQINVQPAVDPLPDQTGQSGKFLTTDGTNASWGDALTNLSQDSRSITICGTPRNDRSGNVNIGYYSKVYADSVAIGDAADAADASAVAIGKTAQARYCSTSIGFFARCEGNISNAIALGYSAYAKMAYSISIGAGANSYATGAIQIGKGENNNAGTLGIGLSTNGSTWHEYELLSADGTIPEARLADTTSATTGQVLQLDSNGSAVWGNVDSLPSQTGNAGKFLTTDGTDASWSAAATIDDNSTSSLTVTWSASKLNTMIGNVETLLSQI